MCSMVYYYGVYLELFFNIKFNVFAAKHVLKEVKAAVKHTVLCF